MLSQYIPTAEIEIICIVTFFIVQVGTRSSSHTRLTESESIFY